MQSKPNLFKYYSISPRIMSMYLSALDECSHKFPHLFKHFCDKVIPLITKVLSHSCRLDFNPLQMLIQLLQFIKRILQSNNNNHTVDHIPIFNFFQHIVVQLTKLATVFSLIKPSIHYRIHTYKTGHLFSNK